MSTLTRVERSKSSNRTQFLTVAIVAGLAVLAGLLIAFVLSSGGAPGQPTAMPPATPVVEAEQDATATPIQDEVTTPMPVVTYEVFLSRDPFEPVVPDPEPEPTDTSGDPSDPSDPTDPADPTDPSDPADPSDPSDGGTTPVSPSDPRCSNGAEVVCEGRVLTAVDIFRDDDGELVAVIQVDTTVFEVRRGQDFSSDPVFRVLDITATTVTLQNGDAAFTLTTGDTVLK